MNRACTSRNANLHEQNQHASSIRPLKMNFVRMKSILLLSLAVLALFRNAFAQESVDQFFPDGTKISAWFLDSRRIDHEKLGKQYVITDFGIVSDSSVLQTKAIQDVINKASRDGGGVVVIPKGTYLSGALFFKPGTHLHLVEGGVLKGSDDISHYPIMPSRMEGQNLDYFPALVNAYGVDGFTLSGKGTLNGNGYKYWESFWQRRKENPMCTNLEVSRPRLVFIRDCNNVQVQDVNLVNSGFWTSHYYKCTNVKVIGVRITSPHTTAKAPSTDAIDIDACTNFLVKGCYMSVNDDAIAIKGGKGPWADKDTLNGPNLNILIEDCEFGYCHSCVTCGSEAIHNRNILVRNCHVNEAIRVLWLKMRPDTPQRYEYITVENVKGEATSLLYISPWRQFFDLKGRPDVPISSSDHIVLRNMEIKCRTFFDVGVTEYDRLSNFTFENLKVEATNAKVNKSLVEGFTLKNVIVNNQLVE